MKIERGQKILVCDRRKGEFLAVASETFDTEDCEFYPVITLQYVSGVSTDWDIGESIPCRRGISKIFLCSESTKNVENNDLKKK